MENKLKSNLPTLVLFSIAGALIYTLPYFRNYYYDVFLEAFNLTNTQMGTLGSAYGTFCLISYVFGGYFADRWKTKTLLIGSLFATGALGFVLLTYPPYPVVLFIHAAWGITSIMTFWGAIIKAIRTLGSENEQGKAFGFFEGGRGITNIVQSIVILAIFSFFTNLMSEKMALSTVIVIYSAICLILGVIVYFLYHDPVSDQQTTEQIKERFNWVALLKVLKMPTTWLATLLIFTSYAMINSYYYITPYATATFGASTVMAAALGYFSQYCRPIGSFGAGILGDRIGVSNVVFVGYLGLILGLLGLIFIPGKASALLLLLVFIAVLYTAMYALQAMHFAILVEGDYPVSLTGTVSMPLMIVGYSGEIFMPLIAGRCLDKWNGGPEGYKALFLILLALAIIGLVTVIIWQKLTKEKRMTIKAERITGVTPNS